MKITEHKSDYKYPWEVNDLPILNIYITVIKPCGGGDKDVLLHTMGGQINLIIDIYNDNNERASWPNGLQYEKCD